MKPRHEDLRSENTGIRDPLTHLPPEERDIVLQQTRTKPSKVGYFSLYRYATSFDMVLMCLGIFMSIVAGATRPLLTVVLGQLANSFAAYFHPHGTADTQQFQKEVNRNTLYFIYLACAVWGATFVSTFTWLYTGERITRQIREQYLHGILRQNTAYFDTVGAGAVTIRITNDIALIQDGISEKVALITSSVTAFISSFIIAFFRSWKLTFILFSILPLQSGTVIVIGRLLGKYSKAALDIYSQGGTLAEEAFSSIRNIKAFGIQEKVASSYYQYLSLAYKVGKKKAITVGAMLAALWSILYAAFVITPKYAYLPKLALAFWEGGRLILKGQVTIGTVITVFLAIFVGSFALGHIGPEITSFTTAVAAGTKVFETIDRIPVIDSLSDKGSKLPNVQGEIKLQNISFVYPSRPKVLVLNDFSLTFPAGKTVALVGASGSGKSTIVNLVERFYDPHRGTVSLDGHNIKDLNLKWLRQQISLVSQEPILFATTIFENVSHGLTGTMHEDADEEKKRDLVYDACVMANANGFIQNLPEGYDTRVGERGLLLSGGQKQRIAIARAIVSNPKILLLDEATSALDTKSESVVQEALDRASKHRTTIVIAHRLSTVKNVDFIVVMSNGQIIERGSHSELLEAKGAYWTLVEAQKVLPEPIQEEEFDQDIVLPIAVAPVPPRRMSILSIRRKSVASLLRRKSVASILRRKSVASVVSESPSIPEPDETTPSRIEYIRRVLSFNKQERFLFCIGLGLAVFCGGFFMAQAVILSHYIDLLSSSEPPERLQSRSNLFALIWLIIAILSFLSYFLVGSLFEYFGEKMYLRIRDRCFRKLVHCDVEFFDRKENSSGVLTGALATQVFDLKGLSGCMLYSLIIILVHIFGGFLLSLIVAWKVTVVVICSVPLLLVTGYFKFSLLAKFQKSIQKAYESSGQFACEATANIKTVQSLTRETPLWKEYSQSLAGPSKATLHASINGSMLFAFSQSLIYLCNGLAFWWGATLIRQGELSLINFFIALVSTMFGIQEAGRLFSLSADLTKANTSATNIFRLLDTESAIGAGGTSKPPFLDIGTITFNNVHFRYPTRPFVPVLRGLDLEIQPGQFVALVGQSGCGKSTVISLIERFYDPVAGVVAVNGIDIKELDLENYRSYISLVSQEPTLYRGTIKFNVTIGATRQVTDEEIVAACKDANIHEFIESLPQGYETVCGQKGSSLSGGQRQRIAIARAIIRNPKVLLLDEATSALDSSSEKLVNQALEKAAAGRTVIAIAHRLSTIQRADVIYFIEGGKVVEWGRHKDLLALGGKYFNLVQMQQLDTAL